MAEFHETGYGATFFRSQLPRLIDALETIGEKMEKSGIIEPETHPLTAFVTRIAELPIVKYNNETQFEVLAELISEARGLVSLEAKP